MGMERMELLEVVFSAAVDDVIVDRQETFGGTSRTALGLEQSVLEGSQVIGLLDGAAVDGRSVHVARHLVDLLPRTQRTADARRRPRSDVLLTFNVGSCVDGIVIGQTNRVALGVHFSLISTAAAQSLTQITFISTKKKKSTKYQQMN